MTFTNAHTTAAPSNFDGINTLVIGIKRQAGTGWIYQCVTPTFPELTAAWSTEFVEEPDLIATLGQPSQLGYLPVIKHFRTDTRLDYRFRAACICSRDYVSITREAIYAPGVNLQPGDVMQMPLSMESALESMLQEQDLKEQSFLADPEELGF